MLREYETISTRARATNSLDSTYSPDSKGWSLRKSVRERPGELGGRAPPHPRFSERSRHRLFINFSKKIKWSPNFLSEIPDLEKFHGKAHSAEEMSCSVCAPVRCCRTSQMYSVVQGARVRPERGL